MKIAIVHWIVNDVGGINSWTENIIIGLRRLGHTVQLYYGSHQKVLGCDPKQKVPRSRRWHLLPAIHLSYDPKFVKSSIKTLNESELILFAHPSPHPTKNNMECKSPKEWQKFYTETSPKKICVFHDRHWDRTNPWISDVKDSVHYSHAAQHHFVPVVKKFSEKSNHGWGFFPLTIPLSPPSNEARVRRIIMATQWLALKNHRYIIPRLMELNVPLHSYGSGQTYHKLLPEMKNVYREDHHGDEPATYNERSPHIHYGHTEYRLLLSQMKRSWFSLDLSIQGMTNMTHWEPMTMGTISVLENRVLSDPYCEIPKECCLSVSLDTVIDDLNRIAKTRLSDLMSIQSNAWEFIQRCDCGRVAKNLLQSAGVM